MGFLILILSLLKIDEKWQTNLRFIVKIGHWAITPSLYLFPYILLHLTFAFANSIYKYMYQMNFSSLPKYRWSSSTWSVEKNPKQITTKFKHQNSWYDKEIANYVVKSQMNKKKSHFICKQSSQIFSGGRGHCSPNCLPKNYFQKTVIVKFLSFVSTKNRKFK